MIRDFVRGTMRGFLALLIVIQLFRPARDNPPVTAGNTLEATLRVPGNVEQILVRSCNDCHSDLTQWPWYTNMAPISWVVARHVAEGRRHLNFSEWRKPDTEDEATYGQQKFESACRQMETGDMPLQSYLLVHRHARLSAQDIETICRWAEGGISAK